MSPLHVYYKYDVHYEYVYYKYDGHDVHHDQRSKHSRFRNTL